MSEITTIDDAPENADWARPDILNSTKIYKAKYNALYNFDANGGTWENDITKRKDTPKEIEDDEPTNGTREFLGWAEADGTTVTYSEISDKDAGTTFYAIWEKIIPTYTLPIGLTANYGDTLSNIDLSSYSTTDGYFSWVDDTTNVGDIGNGLHLIRYTPFDTENYDAVEIEIAIKINKANPIIEVTPSATKIEKGEKLANSTLSGGTVKGINGETLTGSFTWINSDKTFNPSEDSEEHEVLFTPESSNYNTIKCTIIVSAKQSSGQGSAGPGSADSNQGGSAGSGSGDSNQGGSAGSGDSNQGGSAGSGSADSNQGGSAGSGSADSNQGSTNPPAKKKSNKGLTRYTIKATAQNGGEISPSGSFRVIKSKNVKFVITPDEGYEIDVLMVDDEQIENTLEYTFNNVQGPHTIHVTFKKEITNTDKGNDSSNSLGFNRSVHMAYFEGYEDSSFLPDANLTRAETTAILCKILLTPIDLNKNYPTSFSDISSDAWHAKYIGYIESLGLIVGYGDETFRPNNLITRAELVSILCKIEGEDAIYSNIFTDINKTHWAAKSIAYAYNKGWITGYPDGSFNPDAPVSRAEIAVILNKVLNRNVSKLDFNNFRLNQYTDIDESHWAYYDIMEATHTHEYTITNDGIERWTN